MFVKGNFFRAMARPDQAEFWPFSKLNLARRDSREARLRFSPVASKKTGFLLTKLTGSSGDFIANYPKSLSTSRD
jgi:hypothetical protein